MNKFEILKTWTPFLLEGLALNLMMSIVATVIGIALGSLLLWLTFFKLKPIRWVGLFVPTIVRGAPTLFLLFYIAILLPSEIIIFDGKIIIELPNWLKASFALSASPLAFTSWSLKDSIEQWKNGHHNKALLFIPNLTNGFIITLLASSGASLVGVDELVARTNTVIKLAGSENSVLLYSYSTTIFIIVASIITLFIQTIRGILSNRMANKIKNNKNQANYF